MFHHGMHHQCPINHNINNTTFEPTLLGLMPVCRYRYRLCSPFSAQPYVRCMCVYVPLTLYSNPPTHSLQHRTVFLARSTAFLEWGFPLNRHAAIAAAQTLNFPSRNGMRHTFPAQPSTNGRGDRRQRRKYRFFWFSSSVDSNAHHKRRRRHHRHRHCSWYSDPTFLAAFFSLLATYGRLVHGIARMTQEYISRCPIGLHSRKSYLVSSMECHVLSCTSNYLCCWAHSACVWVTRYGCRHAVRDGTMFLSHQRLTRNAVQTWHKGDSPPSHFGRSHFHRAAAYGRLVFRALSQ